jgi:hypothetical protein
LVGAAVLFERAVGAVVEDAFELTEGFDVDVFVGEVDRTGALVDGRDAVGLIVDEGSFVGVFVAEGIRVGVTFEVGVNVGDLVGAEVCGFTRVPRLIKSFLKSL